MKRSAQCPELSSTETLENPWRKKPTTITKLWQRVEEEWTQIKAEQREQLVMSCDIRCAKVIQSKSLYASYSFLTTVTFQHFSFNHL